MPIIVSDERLARVRDRLLNDEGVRSIKKSEHVSEDVVRRERERLGLPRKAGGGAGKITDFSAIDKMLWSGSTDRDIAEELHHSTHTINRRRKQLGIAAHRKCVSPNIQREVIRLNYSPQLFSPKQISLIVGIRPETVIRIINSSMRQSPRSDDEKVQTI